MSRTTYPRGIELVCEIVIENDKGEILLAQSTKWGSKWTLPGGHIEPGETILNALVREGEEETGLQLRGISVFHWGELIGSQDFHRPAHFIFFAGYAKVCGGQARLDPAELTAYVWVTPERALKLDLAEGYADTICTFAQLNECD